MEVETQRVWDYASDGYVHRLIQNKADGKMIELPSVPGRNRDSLTSSNGTDSDNEAQGGPNRATSKNQEKIEAMGLEYSYLLASQLDSQRAYYDKKVVEMRKRLEEAESRVIAEKHVRETWKKEKEAAESRLKALQDETVPELERNRLRSEKKAETATALARKFESDLKSEREVSKGLLDNLKQAQASSLETDGTAVQLRMQINELNEQVRDLMFALTARDKIEQEGGEELVGGSVVVPEPTPTTPVDQAKARRKKKR